MGVADIIVQAQDYIILPHCAALLVAVHSMRACIAPRYLADAATHGGQSSCSWQTWRLNNPKKFMAFVYLVLRCPTVAHTRRVRMPLMCVDAPVIEFCNVVLRHPQHAYVTEICLRKCAMITDVVCEKLVALAGCLRHLDLGYTCIREGVKALAALTQLRVLLLDGVNVSDNHVAPLCALVHLTKLDLSRTKVTSLEPFRNAANLRYLTLRDLNFVENFASVAHVWELDLTCAARFDHGGMVFHTSIRDILPFNNMPDLVKLVLANAYIRRIDFIPPAAAILQHLDCSGCDDVDDLSPISQCKQLLHLSLARCRLTEAKLHHVLGAWRVERLDVSENWELCCVNVLARFELLTELRMSATAVSHEGTYALESLRDLEVLDICRSGMLTRVAQFARFPSLKRLRLNASRQLAADEVAGLSESRSLRLIDLTDTGIGAHHIPQLMAMRAAPLSVDVIPDQRVRGPVQRSISDANESSCEMFDLFS